jgi:pimeloyl-ACP methyl ester carboxylesterase
MATFGLVHGAWHGAWCWEVLQPELEELGQRVRTVELPCDDPAASCSVYADLVVDAFAGEQDDDLVLVGHSLAGLTVPIAAARLRLRHLVFLCSVIATPGCSLVEQLQAEPEMLRRDEYGVGLSEPDELGRNHWVDFDVFWKAVLGDCEEGVARSAFARLKPQSPAPYTEPCPLERLPDVERSYIVCSEDAIVNSKWAAQAARQRLEVDPLELPGSHSPFVSRPRDLARVLVGRV